MDHPLESRQQPAQSDSGSGRVLVVGAGIMGLSTAWALVKRGYEVVILEQGTIPNPLASSVEHHRIIRHPYGKEAGYTRMADQAFGCWEELWRDLGQSFYVQTGILALEKPGVSWMQDSATVLERLGIPFQWLDAMALAQRYPVLNLNQVQRGLLLEQGGALMARAIVNALAHWLEGHGASLCPQSRVIAVDPDKVRLTLANAEVISGDRMVVTAGPWITDLLPGLASRVTPSRQVLLYLEPDAALKSAWQRMPIPFDAQYYAIPPVRGLDFIKLADHTFTRAGHPDQDREPTRAELEAFFEQARTVLSQPERYRLWSGKTCFYTVEPQERFLIEPLGQSAWVASPCSGHGFKFGPLLGQALADAIEGRRTSQSLATWAAGSSV